MTAQEQEIADAMLNHVQMCVTNRAGDASAEMAIAYERLMAGVRNRAQAHYWATLATPIVIQPQPSTPAFPYSPWEHDPVTYAAKTSVGTRTECAP